MNKKIEYILLFSFMLFGLISIENVNAKSVSCEYKYFRISMDDNNNIKSEVINSEGVSRIIKGAIINEGDFIDSNNKWYCKNEIYFISVPTNNEDEANYWLSFTKGFTVQDIATHQNAAYPLTNSEIDNTITANTKEIKKRCVYDNFNILVYSDNTLSATKDNRYREIRFDSTAQKTFLSLDCCPYKIYVADSVLSGMGDTATISTKLASGSDLSYVANAENRCDPETQYDVSDPIETTNPIEEDEPESKPEIKPGNRTDCNSILDSQVRELFNNILKTIQYAGPILVAVFTIVDLVKASLTGDAGELKKVYQKLIKRVVAAILLFFVPTIVNLLIDLVDNSMLPKSCL